jgi:hypothetical protein
LGGAGAASRGTPRDGAEGGGGAEDDGEMVEFEGFFVFLMGFHWKLAISMGIGWGYNGIVVEHMR